MSKRQNFMSICFSIMIDTTYLCLTIWLLSVLLFFDIGLISKISQVIYTEPNDRRTTHEGGLLAYALVILPLVALGLIIAILMLACLLIKKTNNSLSPKSIVSKRNDTSLEMKWIDGKINEGK